MNVVQICLKCLDAGVTVASKGVRFVALPVVVVAFTLACSPTVGAYAHSAPSAMTRSNVPPLDTLFERYHEFVLREYPESATFNGRHEYDSSWTEYSEAAMTRRRTAIAGFLESARQTDESVLSTEQRINRKLFVRSLEEAIASMDFKEYLIPFNQLGGLHLDIQLLADQSRIETDRDRACYLHRLRGFKEQVNGAISLMRTGMKKKMVPPALIMGRVLRQLEQMATEPFDKSPMFIKALKIPTSVTDAQPSNVEVAAAPTNTSVQAETLKRSTQENAAFERQLLEAGRVVTEAYSKLLTFVRDEYYPACRKSIGMSSLPNGMDMYQQRLRMHTTLPTTPDQIFSTGMREVKRLQKRMESLKSDLQFKGSLRDFNNELRTSQKHFFTTREELLQGFGILLSEANTRIQPLFERLPNARCEIKEMESFRAVSAPQAYYNPPPEDGSKPGYFYVNTYNLPSRPIYTMTALTLHEAVPGHHLQVALAQEMSGQPWFRRQLGSTAFVEGWALYAERLGYEMGMYEDPMQEYGALGFEMWRACRLVVDAGMHAKNWTREQAIEFMMQNVPNSEVDIANEVDRYITDPGQACAYKIGQLAILKLREEAEAQLKDMFRLPEFHNVVLRNGAVPLDMLEENVRTWISKKASADK
jgi:prolyl oligopeptidase